MEKHKEEENKPPKKLIFEDGNSLFSWFEKILVMINNYGLKKMFQGIGFIVLFFLTANIYNAFQSREIIEKYVLQERNYHDEGIDRRAQVDPIIRKHLTKLLYTTECDRVYVIETHNGTSNSSGLPFKYGEMSYEEISNHTYEVSNEYTNINISRYEIFSYLTDYKYFIGTIEDLRIIDNKMANKMEANDVKIVAFKLINGPDKPLGILGISYTDCDENFDRNKLISTIGDCSDIIAILLDRTSVKVK